MTPEDVHQKFETRSGERDLMNKLILVIGILLTSVQLQAACGCSKNKQKQEFR